MTDRAEPSSFKVGVAGGSATVRLEPWDCDHLQVRAAKLEDLQATDDVMARAVAAAAVEKASAAGFDHLCARVESAARSHWQALGREGFQLVDVLLRFELALQGWREPQEPEGSPSVEWAAPADRERLGELAARSFSDPSATFNRYLNDGGFSTEQVRRVYRVWASTSVDGAAADATLVCRRGEEIVAFLTLKYPDLHGTASVPLNAVEPTLRGRGLYSALVRQAARAMRDRGAQRLVVATQVQQLAVQRTWARLGARVVASHLTFHRWLR